MLIKAVDHYILQDHITNSRGPNGERIYFMARANASYLFNEYVEDQVIEWEGEKSKKIYRIIIEEID